MQSSLLQPSPLATPFLQNSHPCLPLDLLNLPGCLFFRPLEDVLLAPEGQPTSNVCVDLFVGSVVLLAKERALRLAEGTRFGGMPGVGNDSPRVLPDDF